MLRILQFILPFMPQIGDKDLSVSVPSWTLRYTVNKTQVCSVYNQG